MLETIETVVIEPGYNVEIRTIPIINDVQLKVYNNESAELVINGRECVEIPFRWDKKARALVGRLDEVKAADLLALVASA